jgi:hypothetical protein
MRTKNNVISTVENAAGALAGIQEGHQAAVESKFYTEQKVGVPSDIPSKCFTISGRIRFGLS